MPTKTPKNQILFNSTRKHDARRRAFHFDITLSLCLCLRVCLLFVRNAITRDLLTRFRFVCSSTVNPMKTTSYLRILHGCACEAKLKLEELLRLSSERNAAIIAKIIVGALYVPPQAARLERRVRETNSTSSRAVLAPQFQS